MHCCFFFNTVSQFKIIFQNDLNSNLEHGKKQMLSLYMCICNKDAYRVYKTHNERTRLTNISRVRESRVDAVV